MSARARAILAVAVVGWLVVGGAYGAGRSAAARERREADVVWGVVAGAVGEIRADLEAAHRRVNEPVRDVNGDCEELDALAGRLSTVSAASRSLIGRACGVAAVHGLLTQRASLSILRTALKLADLEAAIGYARSNPGPWDPDVLAGLEDGP